MKKILSLLTLSALMVSSMAVAQSGAGGQKIYVSNSGSSYSAYPKPDDKQTPDYITTSNGYLNRTNDKEAHQSAPVEPLIRPAPVAVKNDKPKEEVVDGTISREQRCKDAQSDIATINERQTIYEEDKNGNLVPLSPEQAQARLEQAKAIAAKVCQ
ncbi:MAG: hypothetical protein Q4B71_07770 [Cardiobacteriaceae bacterium]|nr:hypothetical protein [Cardiobacteriaceae bacterium]